MRASPLPSRLTVLLICGWSDRLVILCPVEYLHFSENKAEGSKAVPMKKFSPPCMKVASSEAPYSLLSRTPNT